MSLVSTRIQHMLGRGERETETETTLPGKNAPERERAMERLVLVVLPHLAVLSCRSCRGLCRCVEARLEPAPQVSFVGDALFSVDAHSVARLTRKQ